MQISTALALSSLPLIFLSSDDQPASLNLPPFEKEVYLSVTAKWARNDCVDVTVVTNLPEGTIYSLRASARTKVARRSCLALSDSRDDFIVTASRIDHASLFCDLGRSSRRWRGRYDTLSVQADLNPREHFSWNARGHQTKVRRQERHIGRFGALLRGPLSRRTYLPYEDVAVRSVQSEPFTLDLLPPPPESEAEKETVEEEGE